MKMIKLGKTDLNVSSLALGCMRLTEIDKNKANDLIKTAMDLGINYFDHADIYAGGESESLFSKAIEINDDLREKIIIQSKCGIRPGICYDFSKEHILNSVDGILKRLNTDYLDILLLHRPDALMDPQEVAQSFDILKQSGKVKYFGVSNQNPYQIELLKKYCNVNLEVNQLQLSITESGMIDSGLNVNMKNDLAINRDGGILDYCRLNDITIQPWSPFQYGFFEGVFLGSDKFSELNQKIYEIASKYNVTSSAIAIAWILRHPANMQPIIGTTNKERLIQIAKATDVNLTREEWYEIYMASGKVLP